MGVPQFVKWNLRGAGFLGPGPPAGWEGVPARHASALEGIFGLIDIFIHIFIYIL